MELKQLGGYGELEGNRDEINIHNSKTLYNQMPIPGNEDDHTEADEKSKIELNSSQCMDLATKLGNEPWRQLHLLLLDLGKARDNTNPRHKLYYIPCDQLMWLKKHKNDELITDADEGEEEGESTKITYHFIGICNHDGSEEE